MATPTVTARETAARPSLDAVLAAGLAWLDSTPQPAGAICNHHGVGLAAADGRSLRFVPRGAAALPVVVLHAYRRPTDNPNIRVALADGELAGLVARIEALGFAVRKTWNGTGCDSGSVGLAKMPHPTLTDAVLRYHAQCPDHHTVFCGGWQASDADQRACRYYPTGYALLVKPTPPTATETTIDKETASR
jgi:hypothetical protein